MAKIIKNIKEIDFEDIQKEAGSVLRSWKNESLSSLQLGFTFASALAWNEVMKSIVNRFVKNGKSSITQTTIYALAITFLAGIITYIMQKVKLGVNSKRVKLT